MRAVVEIDDVVAIDYIRAACVRACLSAADVHTVSRSLRHMKLRVMTGQTLAGHGPGLGPVVGTCPPDPMFVETSATISLARAVSWSHCCYDNCCCSCC